MDRPCRVYAIHKYESGGGIVSALAIVRGLSEDGMTARCELLENLPYKFFEGSWAYPRENLNWGDVVDVPLTWISFHLDMNHSFMPKEE